METGQVKAVTPVTMMHESCASVITWQALLYYWYHKLKIVIDYCLLIGCISNYWANRKDRADTVLGLCHVHWNHHFSDLSDYHCHLLHCKQVLLLADVESVITSLYRKLRTSDHGQLLLNLCFALMGLYVSFIIALHSKDVTGLCVFIAAILQYFFLVTFAVMTAEAVNLYMNLVIVLGGKIHRFVLKVTILSWGQWFHW